jgi:hypothetical protein
MIIGEILNYYFFGKFLLKLYQSVFSLLFYYHYIILYIFWLINFYSFYLFINLFMNFYEEWNIISYSLTHVALIFINAFYFFSFFYNNNFFFNVKFFLIMFFTGIVFGSQWALFSFSGWNSFWNRDVVEIFLIIVCFMLILVYHYKCLYNILSDMCYFLFYSFVLFFLVNSGFLKSKHSFFNTLLFKYNYNLVFTVVSAFVFVFLFFLFFLFLMITFLKKKICLFICHNLVIYSVVLFWLYFDVKYLMTELFLNKENLNNFIYLFSNSFFNGKYIYKCAIFKLFIFLSNISLFFIEASFEYILYADYFLFFVGYFFIFLFF